MSVVAMSVAGDLKRPRAGTRSAEDHPTGCSTGGCGQPNYTGVISAPPQRPPARPWDLLSHGIPLTLLLDLADPDGPDSARLYADEQAASSYASSGR
jgi:hypothetical protein